MKKAIFDMDGLIFDSERIFMRELGIVMEEYGYTLTREHYISTIGITVSAVEQIKRKEFGADYPHEEISKKAAQRLTKLAHEGKLPIKKGIQNLLEELTARGISCVVASSTDTEYVCEYLRTAGLDKYFDNIIGGDKVKGSKPDPDIFIAALDGTAPEDALVLEDSINGVKAAHNAHIPVICIPDMVYPDEHTRSLALAVVDSADDVAPYIF